MIKENLLPLREIEMASNKQNKMKFGLKRARSADGEADENMNPEDARYDQLAHIPHIDTKKSSSRCKQCKAKTTHIYCKTCEVHLCLVTGRNSRNCYKEYHFRNLS